MENLFLQSNSTTTLLVTVVILLVLYVFFPNFDQKTKELPGPRPLPLFGNLLQLDLKSFHSTLFELSKKYGSVFTVYLGHRKVVVLAGYKTVKEALVNHAVEFGERHVTPSSHDLNGSCRNGIIFGNGESWEEMRRFALSNLRDFGMGKKAGEDKIIEEIQYLIKEFEGHEGQPFSAAKSINYAVSNIISSIVYGSRFEYGDEEFKLMVDRANENIQLVGSPSIQLFNMYPWIFQWASNRMRLKRNVAENRKQVKRLIGRLQETLNVHMRRGFVDSFLAHKQRLEDLKISDSHYNFENLVSTTGNLFAAGTDTTGTTLRWVLLLMAKYPRIQDQVQVELSRVVGDRQVRHRDLPIYFPCLFLTTPAQMSLFRAVS
ncbi:cytochrome P450 2K1-like isoform 3-T3 [Spinachia spinachia]